MLFKSQVFTQASGSVGGLTYSHNAGGMYTRSRSIPVNPNSVRQQEVRSALSSLVTRWGSVLTQAQRDAWEVYAANVPVTNKLGDPTNLSGQQQFVRSNVSRIQAGLTIADDAPTTYNLGPYTLPTIAGTGNPDEVEVTFNINDAWRSEDNSALLIYAGLPQNGGVNFYAGPFKYADKILGDSVTPPTSPQTISLPSPVAVGQYAFIEARVSRVDGRLSSRIGLGRFTP